MEDVISAPQIELSILWQQVLPTNSRSFSTDTSTCILLWSARRSFHSFVLVNVAKAVSNDSTDLFCLPLSSAERAFDRAAVGEDLFQNFSLAIERTSVRCWFDNLGLYTFVK